jgi:propionyl-CoA carboxylase alpha chain
MITGIDLVEAQIRVASGEPLHFSQDDIKKSGHAVECRIYAEDPVDNFLPSTGKLLRHRIPSGPGVRVDAGVEEGGEVTINYDPMISKLSVHSTTREMAIHKMIRALSEYEISGCKTTIPFCDFTMKHPSFASAEYDTHFVPDHFEPHKDELFDGEEGIDALAVTLIEALKGGNGSNGSTSKSETTAVQNQSNWWKARQ